MAPLNLQASFETGSFVVRSYTDRRIIAGVGKRFAPLRRGDNHGRNQRNPERTRGSCSHKDSLPHTLSAQGATNQSETSDTVRSRSTVGSLWYTAHGNSHAGLDMSEQRDHPSHERDDMIERLKSMNTALPVCSRPGIAASWLLLGAVAMGIGVSVRAAAAQADKTTFDGVYTDAQSARGEKILGCLVRGLSRRQAGGLRHGSGGSRSRFQGNVERTVGRRAVRQGQDDHAGQRARHPSATDTADVVAYILKVNDYPAGSAELPSEMAALSTIKLRHQK